MSFSFTIPQRKCDYQLLSSQRNSKLFLNLRSKIIRVLTIFIPHSTAPTKPFKASVPILEVDRGMGKEIMIQDYRCQDHNYGNNRVVKDK